MTPTIQVDDEVYTALKAKAEAGADTPNIVLRRLLSLEEQPSSAPDAKGKTVANLVALGVLDAEEKFIWKRRGEAKPHVAWVTAEGWMRLEDQTVHGTPSGAARYLAGYAVNGWDVWLRAVNGQRLSDVWTKGTVGRQARGPAPRPGSSGSKAKEGADAGREPQRTAQKDFRPYILEVLQENGGRLQVSKLLDELERRMEPVLFGDDYRVLKDGEVRWRNAARWERKEMVEEGLLKRTSGEGFWELPWQEWTPTDDS